MNTFASLAAVEYGTAGLKTWIQDNLVTLAILIIGCIVVFKSRQGQVSQLLTIIGGLMLGLAVLGLATGTSATDIGDWIIGLFRSAPPAAPKP